jgi:hypothetical protein
MKKKALPLIARKIYTVRTVRELDELMANRPALNTAKRYRRCKKHLTTDFKKAEGVTRLGFKVIGPYVNLAIVPGHLDNTIELYVDCHEGALSKEEALGFDYVPSPSEIQQRASEIRRCNDQAGLIRGTEYYGHDNVRVYSSTVIIPS